MLSQHTEQEQRVCAGCGGPIEKPRRGSRKWCSERCRKSSYDLECMDCGARIDGTTPSASGGRCMPCANKVPRSAYVIKRLTIEAMWADGLTCRQICEQLGLKFHSCLPSLWRARGYDIPHRRTPEQVRRIVAGANAAGGLEKARAVKKARREAQHA